MPRLVAPRPVRDSERLAQGGEVAGHLLAVARARAQSRLLWAIAGTALTVVIALAAALGWLTGAMRSAVVGAVERGGASAQTTILEIPATAHPAAQADQVARLLSGRF